MGAVLEILQTKNIKTPEILSLVEIAEKSLIEVFIPPEDAN